MEALTDELEAAFESGGYDVGETSRNRDQIRITVLDEEASAEELKSITLEVVDEDEILGFDVTTESLDNERVSTVVSFRYRG